MTSKKDKTVDATSTEEKEIVEETVATEPITDATKSVSGDNETIVVDPAKTAEDLNGKRKGGPHRPKTKEEILSFENLRKEHDMVLSFRSVSLMILAIVLCIPWPAGFIPLKFLFFIVITYAAIYNEVMIGNEYAVRQDKSSKWAHVLSYVALGIVALLFVISAVQVGSEISNLSHALDQANLHLKAAGLTDQMVIGK